MKHKVLLVGMIVTSVALYGQSSAPQAAAQNNITITKRLSYAEREPAKSGYFDLYEPIADSSKLRPLIIWMHGGGFKYGSNTTACTRTVSHEFAKRGYVCAAINYRHSKRKPLVNFPDLVSACVAVMEDVDKAIVYFKNNSVRFRIDTNKIILGGNSAGGITAMHSGYASPYEMMKMINDPGADGYSRNRNTNKVAAIISFWGAIFDTTWLANGHIPIVCVHGERDGIVPFDHRKAPIFGSRVIHRDADLLSIPNAMKSYPGVGHELQRHFNPFLHGAATKKRWREAAAFAVAFLQKQLI